MKDLNYKLKIKSFNTFPTASGCASSASSMSGFVVLLSKLFKFTETYPNELSAIARLGSGSACRSMYGGFVEWEKVNELHGNSTAKVLYDWKHWESLKIVLLVVSSKKKSDSSTDGMKLSKETSELFHVYLLPKFISIESILFFQQD